MKRRIAYLVALTLVLTSLLGFSGDFVQKAAAASAFQRVTLTSAVVTAAKLNVRQGAATTHPVVCQLSKGQTVTIIGKMGEWYAVYVPGKNCVGAAMAKYLKTSGAAKTPAATPKTTAPKTTTPKTTTPKTTTPKTTTPKTTTPQGGTTTPSATLSAEEQQMLDLVNKARSDAGVAALKADGELMKVARLKAQDMVDKGYFSHQSPTYGSPFDMMRQFGISFKSAGENIAGNKTVEGAFNAWMNSEGHRKNILNGNYDYTGIGIVSSPTYGKMFVQMFIKK